MTKSKIALSNLSIISPSAEKELNTEDRIISFLEPSNEDAKSKFLVSEEFGAECRGGERIIRLFKSDHVRFSISDGMCFLTEVAGAFNGFAERAHVHLDSLGNWEMYISSGGSPIRARGRAILYRLA